MTAMEQIRRQDCPYCHEDKGAKELLNHFAVAGASVYLSDDGYLNGEFNGDFDTTKIHYCPMCGRNLGGKQ